ncbi:unnamed protein product [Orchesella dallaii]|uniref:Uncharacterized protein n=1 Tax=Orchesella dallaii TaxID=48710 RepID=A0ABP1RDX3_9HEXA
MTHRHIAVVNLLAIIATLFRESVQQPLAAQLASTSGITLIPQSPGSVSYPSVNDLRNILRQQQQQQPYYQILTQNQSPPIQLQSQILNPISPQLGYSPELSLNRLSTLYQRQPQVQSGYDITNPLLPSGGPQIVQIPCVLSLQTPLSISAAPGASQVTVSDTINSPQFTIPGSYIDNSTPLVPILRPPFVAETVGEAGGFGVGKTVASKVNPSLIYSHLGTNLVNSSPIAAVTTTTVTETEKGKARSEYDLDENVQRPRKQGRQTYPLMMYALLSPQLLSSSSGAGIPIRSSLSPNIKRNQQQQQLKQNQNPFFSVNKRKHFEHYEYF